MQKNEMRELTKLIKSTIDPDMWISTGGSSNILPYPSNTTTCTVEDIFGSREAFQSMLSTDDNPPNGIENPFGDDPFAKRDPFGNDFENSNQVDSNTDKIIHRLE